MSLFTNVKNSQSWKALLAGLLAACSLTGAGIGPGSLAYAGPPIELKALCEPRATLKDLRDFLRSHIRVPETSVRYDDIASGVIERLAKACLQKHIPEAISDQEARVNTWVRDSRIDAIRRNQRFEFGLEIERIIPAESYGAPLDLVQHVHKNATARQRVFFDLLAQGLTQEEIAEREKVALGTVNKEKQAIEALIKQEFTVPETNRKRTGQRTKTASGVERAVEKTPIRTKSPIGQAVFDALKAGATVTPTGGGYAGPVMTVTIPASQIAEGPLDGIAMLPSPVVLESDAAGEQQMIATAVQEIGDGSTSSRTFALYAFCKDEHLDAPRDISRYVFKSVVSDPKVATIVTKSNLQNSEAISKRLWNHYRG